MQWIIIEIVDVEGHVKQVICRVYGLHLLADVKESYKFMKLFCSFVDILLNRSLRLCFVHVLLWIMNKCKSFFDHKKRLSLKYD